MLPVLFEHRGVRLGSTDRHQTALRGQSPCPPVTSHCHNRRQHPQDTDGCTFPLTLRGLPAPAQKRPIILSRDWSVAELSDQRQKTLLNLPRSMARIVLMRKSPGVGTGKRVPSPEFTTTACMDSFGGVMALLRYLLRKCVYQCGGCGRTFGAMLPITKADRPLCGCGRCSVVEPQSLVGHFFASAVEIAVLLALVSVGLVLREFVPKPKIKPPEVL